MKSGRRPTIFETRDEHEYSHATESRKSSRTQTGELAPPPSSGRSGRRVTVCIPQPDGSLTCRRARYGGT